MDMPGGVNGAQTGALSGRRAGETCRRFLKSLGQTVKLVSLYKANHPVPSSSMQETWHDLQELFAETGSKEAAFALVEGRWVFNGETIADAAVYELLSIVFRSHALQSIAFLPGVRLYELAALCEMASTPPNRIYESDAGDYMKERGVKHIRINVEEFVRSRRVKLPASAMIESPIPRRAEPPRAAPAPATEPPPESAGAPVPAPAGKGFGAFIKSLVDESVKDPVQRAALYAEAVQLVKHALARHVSEATHQLFVEKHQAVNERARTENVMARVADGKVIVDKEGRVLMMDPVAEEISGKQFSAMAGKPLLESLGTGEQMVALSQDRVISEGADISGKVDLSGDKEVIDAFRQSLALVQDEKGRLIGTYAVLPYVTKFREAMRLQEQFVASITHDLKAPLSSICAALEIINKQAGPKMSPDEARFLDISLRNSRVLKQMISEILDFSKIRQGKMSVSTAPTEVCPMLKESADALGPWAGTKRLTLEIECSESAKSLPLVLADHSRVVQIINNLVSNAIKCTDEGGRVVLRCARGEGDHAGMVVISVTDTGCGISPADQSRIFEKFTQIHAEGARREGVGLGLTIVKELVALHMGKLWLESEPGKGSTFFFSLPTVAAEKTS